MRQSPALEALLARHPDPIPCAEQMAAACRALIAAFERDGKLLLCDTGGSPADCAHIAGELLKGFARPHPLLNDLRAKPIGQGPEGEALVPRCDTCVLAPGDTTAEVQESHVLIYHYLCREIETHFFPH